jgi:phenylpropionate dioxygenase-like ring-hydroxylating dioxygenase large terminal subunit
VKYLENAWYAAAWSEEIVEAMLPRKLLGRPIVLYRNPAGKVNALTDRCPHRFAPLHMGKLHGDVVECPYHGLRFDGSGTCVHNPHGDGTIPRAACVPSHPVVERYRLVWVWMGAPELADASSIPDFSYVDDPAYTTVTGSVSGAGHYELYSDNILDLGHAEFLHTGLGAPAFTKGPREIYQDGLTVWSNVHSLNDYLSPLHAALKQLEGRRLDWWVDTRWDPPASMDLTLYVDEIGGSRQTARWIDRTFHIMTPETESTTHYFWAASRNYRREEVELSRAMQEGFTAAFENEDKPMIAAQQANMETTDFWSLRPVLLAGDAGGVRARRVLAGLISGANT